MAEKLSQSGSIELQAGEPVRIDPELVLSGGSRIAPNVVNAPNCLLLDVDTDPNSGTFGTFRIQNITSAVVTVLWKAEYSHSIQARGNQALQSGVGPLGLLPAPPAASLGGGGGGTGPMPNVLFINAGATPGTGDGSVGAPFASFTEANAFVASQADNQQWAYLPTGTFVEDPVFPAAQTFFIVGENFFEIQGDVTLQKDSTNQTTDPLFFWVRFNISGSIFFEETGAPGNTIMGMIDGTVETGLLNNTDTGQVNLAVLRNVRITEAGGAPSIAHSNLNLLRAESCIFGGSVLVLAISNSTFSQFNEITVGVIGAFNNPRGFFNTVITSDFTGPPSSFIVDEYTQRSFTENGGVLGGGATLIQTSGRSRLPLQMPESVPGPAIPWTAAVNSVFNVDSDVLGAVDLPVVGQEHVGQIITIKRRIGSAANLDVNGAGAQTIDGAGTSSIVSAGGSRDFMADPSIPGWQVVGGYLT